MKKTMELVLSATVLAVFSAACCTSNDGACASSATCDGMFQAEAVKQQAVKQAIQADIDRRIADYVEPYEDLMPNYTSDMVKDLFVNLPEFAQWKKVFAMEQLPEYASADGKIRQKFVNVDGNVQFQVTGAEIEKGYLDELALVVSKPLSCVSKVDLTMVDLGEIAATPVPVEVLDGDDKCYPLFGTPKLGSGSQVFHVTTDAKKLKKVSLLNPEGMEIISIGGFDKFSVPTIVNIGVDGASKMLMRQYSE